MIGWAVVIALAALAFGVGASLLRVQRQLWTLLAAILVFGLAGYAWQGSPDYPSAPAQAREQAPRSGDGLVDARREFFDPADIPANFVMVSDGFTRRGDFGRAAEILGRVVAENPNNGEAWLALHVALVEHGKGRVSEPAEFALRRASAELERNPAPAFFAGLNALREGDPVETRKLWQAGLDAAEDDAPGRDFLAGRIAGLDRLLAALAERASDQARGQADGQAGAHQSPTGE